MHVASVVPVMLQFTVVTLEDIATVDPITISADVPSAKCTLEGLLVYVTGVVGIYKHIDEGFGMH